MLQLLNISFDFSYLPLLVLVALAWLIPMALSLLRVKRVPSVIVEIVLGYFVGHYVLAHSTIGGIYILNFLALTGFIFLMFLSGLEIDMEQLLGSFPRKKLSAGIFIKNPLLVALTYFCISLVLSIAASWALSFWIAVPNVWYFSLIMVTTSVGIILPVLKNRGEASSLFGQMVITSAAVADILGIILFTFTAFILKNGFRFDILYIFILFAAFFFFYQLGSQSRKWVVLRKISFQLSHAASQISIRGSLFLLLIFVVIAQYISPEAVLLGAFLCGLLLSLFMHKGRSLLLVKLDGMGFGFFIPIFFMMVGATFNPAALAEFDLTLIPLLIVLLVVLFVVKIVPSVMWFRQFGLRKALSGGVLMSSRLSLIIAAAAIGLEMGLVTPGLNACFILLAVATCFLAPLLHGFIDSERIFLSDKTIIVGGSSVGVLLARRLKIHGRASIIVEKNEKRFNELKQKGFVTYYGDGAELNTFLDINTVRENHVVVITGSDASNVQICEMLRHDLNHEKIISTATGLSIERMLKKFGVESVDTTRVMATTIENLILRPATYHALVDSFENFSVEEIHVQNTSVDSLQLKDVAFHKDAILIMLRRGSSLIIPHGESYLRVGDVLTVFGTNTAMEDARLKLSGNS